MPHRLPVDAGRLHGDMGDAALDQPLGERAKARCHGCKRTHLGGGRPLAGKADAGHHRILVHVKTGAARIEHLHATSSSRAAGVESSRIELYKACSGADRRPVAQSGVLRGLRVQLSDGLDGTKHRSDLSAGEPGEVSTVSSAAGGLRPWPTIQELPPTAGVSISSSVRQPLTGPLQAGHPTQLARGVSLSPGTSGSTRPVHGTPISPLRRDWRRHSRSPGRPGRPLRRRRRPPVNACQCVSVNRRSIRLRPVDPP
jgi:hypothetical protein